MTTEFDEIALAIGRFNQRWVNLEHALRSLLYSTASLISKSDQDERIHDGVFEGLTADFDFRRLVSTSKILIHGVADDRYPELFEQTSVLFNHLDSRLRVERNRWIHDHWFPFKSSFYSVRYKATFQKSPHQRADLKYMDARYFETADELDDVIHWVELGQKDIMLIEHAINLIHSDMIAPEVTPFPDLSDWKSISFF